MNSILTDAPCSARTFPEQTSSRAISAPLRRRTCRVVRLISSRGSADLASRVGGLIIPNRSGRAVSPVRTCPVPEAALDLTASIPACGSSGCGLFGHEDPFGCSLRTFLLSELAATTGYTMRWRRSVTPCGRSWWVLRLSGRRSDETEFGLWPTAVANDDNKSPEAHDAERGAESRATKAKRGAGGVNLREACNWPTPRSEDSEQTGAHETPDTLTSASRWCSPNASMAEAGTTSRSGDRKGELLLAGQCRQDHTSTNGKRRGSLNPAWVSQLMGYPDGWLDLPAETLSKLSATPSSRKSRRRSSGPG